MQVRLLWCAIKFWVSALRSRVWHRIKLMWGKSVSCFILCSITSLCMDLPFRVTSCGLFVRHKLIDFVEFPCYFPFWVWLNWSFCFLLFERNISNQTEKNLAQKKWINSSVERLNTKEIEREILDIGLLLFIMKILCLLWKNILCLLLLIFSCSRGFFHRMIEGRIKGKEKHNGCVFKFHFSFFRLWHFLSFLFSRKKTLTFIYSVLVRLPQFTIVKKREEKNPPW